MSAKWHRLNRKVHFWGSIFVALPLLIVLVSGVLLLLKKNSDWIQPSTVKMAAGIPTVSYEKILAQAVSVPEAEIQSWKDIDRLDVRPSKGIIKVQSRNQYEIQLDQKTGKILQIAYRRSDFFESLHDGSYFHKYAKLGLFLPAAIVLLVLSLTGLYLFVITINARRRKSLRLKQQGS